MTALPPHLTALVRGWVHGNAVIVRGDGGACDLVDSGYGTGVDALLAALPGAPGQLALTHVHADHCGGAAALQAWGARVLAHPDAADLVDRWDTRGLWLDGTGQQCARFGVDDRLGEAVSLGGRPWTVLHTPGHATGGVSFFDPRDGVLITGDALWEDGFGLLDPWVDGEGVFDGAAAALDALSAVDAAVVIPGHGAPFTDLPGALARARGRLDHLARRRDRLRLQVVRNGLGFFDLAHPEAPPARRAAVARSLGEVHGMTAAQIHALLSAD